MNKTEKYLLELIFTANFIALKFDLTSPTISDVGKIQEQILAVGFSSALCTRQYLIKASSEQCPVKNFLTVSEIRKIQKRVNIFNYAKG